MTSDPQRVSGLAAICRPLLILLLGLSLALVVVAVALPAPELASLRSDHALFGRSLNWLEMSSPEIDLEHVILFAWVGFLLGRLWRSAPWWRVMLAMTALSAVSEFLQFVVPGRSPLISDVRDDLLGMAIALALVIPLRSLSRSRR